MKLSESVKNKIIKYFLNKPGVAAVYLYGSFARGDAGGSSDIDLAALVTDKHKYTGFGIFRVVFARDLSEKLGREVEVQDLEACSIDFVQRVLSEGKLLISNNERIRVDFETSALRKYFDMKPLLDEYFVFLSKRAKEGKIGVRYI